MVGAFVGDLAAWTWLNDYDKFYPYLISTNAEKSDYADVMIFTAETLLNNPTITNAEYLSLIKKHFGTRGVDSEYAVIRAIVIGWLYDGFDDNLEIVSNYCLCKEKEAWYASHFLCRLIVALRNGLPKKEVINVNFVMPFHCFVEDAYWKNGLGVLSYLVRAWISFSDAYDFGSAIHNAVKQPGNIILNCILAGALADAMYGCGNYYVKKQFLGGCHIAKISYLDERIYQINENKRVFFAKNNALINVDKHFWYSKKCQFTNKNIDKELYRRILKAFYTGWDDRYGFYFDDGWVYVYRSYKILSRFRLMQQPDGNYRIRYYQISDEFEGDISLYDVALQEALYSVEYRWNLISGE